MDIQSADALEQDGNSWKDWPFLKDAAEGGHYDFMKPSAPTLTTKEERKKRNREVADLLLKEREPKKAIVVHEDETED